MSYAFFDTSQIEQGLVQDNGAKVASAATLKKPFTKAAGHVSGKLSPIDAPAVQELINAFYSGIRKIVEPIAPIFKDKERHEAIYEYAVALSRTRQKVNSKALAALKDDDIDTIKEKAVKLLENLTELDTELEKELKAQKIQEKKESGEIPRSLVERIKSLPGIFKSKSKAPEPEALLDELDKNKRRYFRFEDNSVSCVKPFIEKCLADNGYTITDYISGYASNDDGKNIKKIGKILNSLEDVPPGLLKAFTNDPCRIDKKLMVVLTREPTDIARGSFGRGWQSCRAGSGAAASNGVREHAAGVIAAYLVTEDDPDIHDPLGRVYLKPFDNRDKTQTVYFTFNPIGLHVPAFVDAVNTFADENLNEGKFGKFNLRDNCESYREMQERMRLPVDAEAALKQLGAKFRKENGKIIVSGNLDLSGLGLSKLPDLTAVALENGGIDVSNNKLLSLQGIPQCKVKSITANGTLISSLAGCPPKIEGTLSYEWSAYLLTTAGAPKAAKYIYGGGYHRSNDTILNSDKPGCPINQPDQFPRFKRA